MFAFPRFSTFAGKPSFGGIDPKGGQAHSLAFPAVPISIVIPTINEAARIWSVIERLHWADEVIVADGGSCDGTAESAAAAGAKVLDASGGTIAFQRNAAIAVARNRWILAVDIDEHVPSDLQAEIAATIKAPSHDAYRIRFRNFYLGHEMRYGRWGYDWHVRLFQSDRRYPERRVHERLEAVSDIGSLRACIEHHPYRDLNHHLEKMVRYARWAAEDLAVRERRPRFSQLTFRPLWRFTREYLLSGGWLDGRAGLMVASLSAFSALLKYAYLQEWEWKIAERTSVIPKGRAPTRPAAPRRASGRLLSSGS